MPDQTSRGSVTVFIYEPEFDYLKWLVLQKRKIETGGDLFGLWQDENTAVVQFILGPGQGCRRTTTSFHQDVDYLTEVGGYLTSSQGLCNIGEWHSHHTLGLAEPSYGDQQTVWNHISSVAGGRFLVFIANIRGTEPKVNVGCFLFNWNNQEMLRGDIKCLPCSSPVQSPVRLAMKNPHITSNAEFTQDWTTYMIKCQTSIKKDKKHVVDSSSSKDGHGTSRKSSTKNDDQDERDRNRGNGNSKNKSPLTTNVLSNGPKDVNSISNTSSTGNDRLAPRNGDINKGKNKDNTRSTKRSTPNAQSLHTSNNVSNNRSTEDGSHGPRNMNGRKGKANTKNVNPSTPKPEDHTSNDDDNGISNSRGTENDSHGSRNSDMNKRNGVANTRNVNLSTPKTKDHTSNKENSISNIPRRRGKNPDVGDNKTKTNSTSSHVVNKNSNIKNSKSGKKNNQFNKSKTTTKKKKRSRNKPRQMKRLLHEQQFHANDCGVKKLSKCWEIVKILRGLCAIAMIIIIIYVAVVNKITFFR